MPRLLLYCAIASVLLTLGPSDASAQGALAFPILFAEKVWAIGYALTALFVVLGMVVVCRPSRRRPKKKSLVRR